MTAQPTLEGGTRPELAPLLASSLAFTRQWPSDQLGTFRVAPHAVASPARAEVMRAIRTFLPQLRNGGGLSRGRPYYDVGSALHRLPLLVTACRLLAEPEEDYDTAVVLALYENLFNAVAAISFAFWEECCDGPVDDPTHLDHLRRLLDTLPRLAELHLRSALEQDARTGLPELDWQFLGTVHKRVPSGVKLRRLREFDGKSRVINEVLYIGTELCPRYDVDVLVFPLYGALSIASYFEAMDRLVGGFRPGKRLRCLPIRLGFHNLGGIHFLDAQGKVLSERLLPIPWIDDALRIIAGRRVLVVDDNAGLGTTLRACKQFVRQSGGDPLARSAETSWELFQSRVGGHNLADAVDFPSLRSNLSYAAQCAMAGCLMRGAYDRYAELTASSQAGAFRQQLRLNYASAQQEPRWQPAHLNAMEHELRHALANWEEPAYPLPTVDRYGTRR